jgi:hypothetical protein
MAPGANWKTHEQQEQEETMALAEGCRQNFDTIARAVANGDAALLECRLAATGEPVPVICAVNSLPNDDIEFVPLAMLFTGNPYEAVNPPNPDGGFFGQEEVHAGPSD